MNKNSKETLIKKQKKVIILIIIMSIITLILVGISFAKYFGQDIIKANTKIAEPIIILENGENVEISNNNKEGEYSFKVKNYNNEQKITDVCLNYNIQIIAKQDNAIKYSLLKNNEEIQINENKTQNMFLINNEKQEDNYILKIKYDESLNDTIEDLIQDIQIKIHSEQTKI